MAKLQLLYDFDTASDRLVIVQSLLLMTLHPAYTMKTDKKEKDASHFLTIAISLAFSLGLNRNTTATFDTRRRGLERRIWWILFIRDRLLPLDPDFASGANLVRIKRVDCGIQILNLTDFDICTEQEESMDGNIEGIRRRKNARECVDKALLCWCSGDRLICDFPTPYFVHRPPRLGEYTSARYESFSGTESPHNAEAEELILTAGPSATIQIPVFESSEESGCFIESSTASSIPEDCRTPSIGEENIFLTADFLEKDMNCESPFAAGHGMEVEHDDYQEYFSI